MGLGKETKAGNGAAFLQQWTPPAMLASLALMLGLIHPHTANACQTTSQQVRPYGLLFQFVFPG